MHLRNGILSCLAALAVAPAWGSSFDLLYLPNNVNNKVTRFDPANQVNLGSFGFFNASSVRYVGIGNNNRAYVTTGGGTTIMNAATGAVVGGRTFPADKISVSPSGNRVIEGFASTIIRYDSNLADAGQVGQPMTLNSVLSLTDTISIGFGVNGSGNLRAQVFNGLSLASTTDTLTTGISGTLIGSSQVSVSGSIARWGLSYMSGSTRRLIRGSTNTTTGTTFFADFNMPGGLEYSPTAALLTVPAHQGYWVIGDDASSATLTRMSYFAEDGQRLFSYTTSAIDVPTVGWGGHIVLAPEPGTMAALGAGVLALLRRKRRPA